MPGAELELLSAPALRQLLANGTDTVVVPFGSVEDQGGHLPLGADSLLADLVGREVAARLDAVLAPTIRVGAPDGTVSVAAGTLTDTALAITQSLARAGFGGIVLLPIHGGNVAPLNDAVARFTGPARACAPRGDVGPDPGSHSGKWLTSVMLAFRPEVVELAAANPSLRAELGEADPDRRGGVLRAIRHLDRRSGQDRVAARRATAPVNACSGGLA